MAKPSVDEIISQKHKRLYVQFGGARPANPVRYGGVDGQYMMLGGLSKSYGSIDPIHVPDPRRIGRYRNVGRSITPGDLPSGTITLLEQHGAVPLALGQINCPFNVYEVTGNCKDLSDFTGGWTAYVNILAGGEVTDLAGGDRTAWDSDDQIENALDVTFADIYPIGSILLGEEASNEVSREVVDIVYGGSVQCGHCGPADDGTKRIYSIARASGSGSPGLPGELIYSLDGGLTWVEAAITGIGASEDPTAIDIVGDKLVILTGTAGGATTSGYYWSTLNANTGVPGTFTKVTSGFVATKVANDLHVLSPRDVLFVGNGGYIYKTTDITSGVSVVNAGAATTENLLRVSGMDDTLYVSGANSTVLKSTNRGDTWATVVGTVPTTTSSLLAVCALDKYRAWVGSASGRLFSTVDGGETWTEKVVASAAAIRDIVFPTDEVGYVAYDSATPTAAILTTWNGGADWAVSGSGPRLQNLPTMDRINRIATPQGVDSLYAANFVALAALHGDGLDGLIALGAANIR